jgi:hypothetical protein
MMAHGSDPKAGDWVEVRSREEILATLDDEGRLEGLPFMPEMLRFCGRRLRVFKRAHKTCDTVNKTGGRRLKGTVHLENVRCDGSAHGGCQAACLIFWKERWLKHVSQDPEPGAPEEPPAGWAPAPTIRSDEDLARCTRAARSDPDDPTYVCQATELPVATTPLPWWDVRQYIEDYASGNVGLRRMLSSFGYSAYNRLINLGIGWGGPLRWLYDAVQRCVGGVPYPRRPGKVPPGTPTPTGSLGLQPGEWVRVKRYERILDTLDRASKNRGMYFDPEEVPYCGGLYMVASRVDRIINERTGKMMRFENAAVILDGVYCQARYSDRRLFCPRSIYPMWREIWLERAAPPADEGTAS